tara:strand:- start:770 stop:994 length:225 start_codon:yes stop_codon:yes gene_type:complete
MFKKCLIDQVIIDGSLRGKSLEVVKKYLKRCYHIEASLDALKKRKRRLWASGKIKKVALDFYNKLWLTSFKENI